MNKRLSLLAGAFALLFALSSCGARGDAPAVSQTSSSSPSASSEDDLQDSAPRADDALAREIVKTYGAEEETAPDGSVRLFPSAVSLYYLSEDWEKPEDLSTGNYFSWFYFTTIEEDYEYMLLAYRNPLGENMGWFYPQDIFEDRVQSHFDVSSDLLRSDPFYYNAQYQGYTVGAGGPGIGERPDITYSYTQEGDTLTLNVVLHYEHQPVSHILTVRLEPGGGWKYISCKMESPSV